MKKNTSFLATLFLGVLLLHCQAVRAEDSRRLYMAMYDAKCIPAFATLQRQATAGDADSQFFLGAAYSNGVCVSKSGAAWIEWLRKAEAQGHATARFNLAISYEYGSDVPLNEQRAFELYRKLADQRIGVGQFNVGRMYEDGLGGFERNDRLAVEWYRKAADQEVPNAQDSLGRMYEQGRGGLEKDTIQARKWYQKAAKRRNCGVSCNDYCEFIRPEAPLLSALICLVSPAPSGSS